MLNLELVHISMRGKSAEQSIQATHTSNRENSGARAEIIAAPSYGSAADQIESSQRNAAKEAGGKLGIMSAPIDLRGDGVITERQRLAPEITSGLFEPFTFTRRGGMEIASPFLNRS